MPLSLAHTNGSLREWRKHILINELLKGICPSDEYKVKESSTLVTDEQGLVLTLGKH